MKNCSIHEIATALGLVSRKKNLITHFAIDSRKVGKGGMFFALRGEKVDGHQFLEEVAAKGALCAVVSYEYTGSHHGLELLRVKDVLSSLQNLAEMAMRSRKEKIIAITGSMGKTTTKEFLATLLDSTFRVGKSQGNFNSQRTFPLNILNLDKEYDVLIFEMGMSEKGQIQRLAEIARPHIGVVTRIAPAGIEQFRGGLEAVAQAKGEIFSQTSTTLGIVSSQAAQFRSILHGGNVPKWIYGWKNQLKDHRHIDFVMEKKAQQVQIGDSPLLSLPFEAAHLAENFLAAAVVARALGVSWHEISSQALLLKPVERRFERIEKEGVIFIQDSYNANPDSMRAALENLPKVKGRRIGVLGTMPDLGEASSYFHEQMGHVAKSHLDQIFCFGEETKVLAKAFTQGATYFETLAALKKELFSSLQSGDVVLIKGANDHKLWEILEK